jgi:hypothetical protein
MRRKRHEHQMFKVQWKGGEYFSNEFNEYLKKQNIQRKYSCNGSPQQNGIQIQLYFIT